MRRIVLAALVFASASTGLPAATNINSITDNGPVGLYNKFEITYGLGQSYSNPYDPAVIDVNVNFTSPTGKQFNVNGFIYQAYTSAGNFNSQTMTTSGGLVWKARFAPDETGTWNYSISAYDGAAGVTVTAGAKQFTVNASAKKSFVRVSSKDSRYFAYDSGETYFPVGENMGWSGNNNTYQYDTWVPLLAAAGGNYIRVWNAPWHTEVEWSYTYPASPPLPGNYGGRQAQAWQLDHIMDLADANGVKILLNLIYHGEFSSATDSNWGSNPYNSVANTAGGVISAPQQVWTNASVQAFLQRKWRYYISRYAYSTALFTWELWNEMEWTDDYADQVASSEAWHQMARNYIYSKDPYRHMISTSYANELSWPSGAGSVWDTMDFTQGHNYGGTDLASYINGASSQMRALNPGKPFMMEELGLSSSSSGSNLDPTGISIHESNWAAVMSACGGGAMPWWWDTWIHPSNLYYRWIGPANFLKGEALDAYNYAAVQPAVSTSVMADYLVSPGFTAWDTKAPQDNFTVNSNGTMTPSEANLGSNLYGQGWYSNAYNPPTFHVNYPAAGKFVVSDIAEYSGSNGSANALEIDLDGVPALTQDPTLMGNNYSINVPAGAHTIFVTNTLNDWITVSYTFTNYTGMLRCYALNGTQKMLGWVQSRNSTYWQQYNKVTLTAVPDGVVQMTGMSNDGLWRLNWWDTFNGVQTVSQDCYAYSGNMSIPVPAITADIAFKAVFVANVTPTISPTITVSPTITLTSTITPTATITPTCTPRVAAENLDHAHVYPSLVNAGKGGQTLTFTELTQKCTVRVFDMNGAIVFSSKVDSAQGQLKWDIGAGLAPGLYIYVIIDENKNYVRGKIAVVR